MTERPHVPSWTAGGSWALGPPWHDLRVGPRDGEAKRSVIAPSAIAGGFASAPTGRRLTVAVGPRGCGTSSGAEDDEVTLGGRGLHVARLGGGSDSRSARNVPPAQLDLPAVRSAA